MVPLKRRNCSSDTVERLVMAKCSRRQRRQPIVNAYVRQGILLRGAQPYMRLFANSSGPSTQGHSFLQIQMFHSNPHYITTALPT